MPWLKPVGRLLIGASFVAIGVLHFTNPAPFVQIMPAWLPWHLELIYLSGAFEILGGVGLLLPVSRRFSAWGLVALLVAVFPANINMLVNEIYLDGMPHEPWLLWARLPMQPLFALLVMWAGEIGPWSLSRKAARATRNG